MTTKKPAHPRACGENATALMPFVYTVGSSPRVRGKFQRQRALLHDGGLIPARAGKMKGGPPPLDRRTAHPRACGENVVTASGIALAIGSSPRVRGKCSPRSCTRGSAGLIPARAGKMTSTPGSKPSSTAHPRACGENSQHPAFVYPRLGSSPRVRGKFLNAAPAVPDSGLIPARAGKITGPRPPKVGASAHPRACGEN